MTAIYRITQGVRALVAFTQAVDYTLPEKHLSPGLLSVFKQMQRNEQLHSVRVLQAVLAQEAETPHDLAVAALMHDSGKVHYPLSVYGKTVAVLGRKIAPLYRYASGRDPARAVWARPFIVAEHHATWSADILREYGASERAIWLVEHHQHNVAGLMDHPYAGLLWRLQRRMIRSRSWSAFQQVSKSARASVFTLRWTTPASSLRQFKVKNCLIFSIIYPPM